MVTLYEIIDVSNKAWEVLRVLHNPTPSGDNAEESTSNYLNKIMLTCTPNSLGPWRSVVSRIVPDYMTFL